MNIELILALGTAIAAVVSPYLTSKDNNRHQRMMKKMDLIYAEKYKAYSNFCSAYAVATSNPTQENIAAFKASANQAYLLNTDSTFRSSALSCANHIAASSPKSEEEFLYCSKLLSLDLDEMAYNFSNPIE